MMNTHSTAPGRHQQGSVILVVLGTILLVSVLLARFIAQTGTELVVASRNSDQSQLRREAYSALETTLAVLAEFKSTDGALYAPEQGWQDPLGYAGQASPPGMRIEITFADETGKLSLPTASPEAIRILLESSGVEPAKVRVAADALLAWSRRDYLTVGQSLPQAIAPGRPLRTFDELASIPGLRELITDADGRPNEIWGRIEQAVSLHTLSTTNLNTATPAALHTMGWTQAQIMALQAARTANSRLGYAESVEGLAPLLGAGVPTAGLGTQIEILRIRVVARSGGMSYRLEAVVAPRPASALADGSAHETEADLRYPFRVLEFQENPEFREPVEESI